MLSEVRVKAGRVLAIAGWLVVMAVHSVVGANRAQAASIVGRSVEDMAQHADLVVRATVLARHHEVDAAGTPWTRAELAVTTVLKGPAGDTVEVWQQGGPLPDGSVVVIPGDLVLDVGGDHVLFLSYGDGDRLYSHLLGWSVFDVRGDGPLARVVRNAGGADLFVAGPKIAGDAPTTPKPPVTLGQLTARVAAALGEAP